jgi:hypothetical protein
MKMILIILTIINIASFAYGDMKDDKVEEIRNDLITRVLVQQKKENIPSDIVEQYIAIIRDDSSLFPIKEMERSFNNIPSTREQHIRRMMFLMAILFRERDNQKTVMAFIGKFTDEDYGIVIGSLSTFYKPLINRDYLPFLLKILNSTIKDAENMADNYPTSKDETKMIEFAKKQGGADEMAIECLELVVLTEHENAGPEVKKILERYVRRSDFRFNLVSVAISRMGVDALPIAEWYFREFAWRPFNIAILARYLRKYDNPTTVDSLLRNKQETLQESLSALNPKYDTGVPGDKSTQLPESKPSESSKKKGKQ